MDQIKQYGKMLSHGINERTSHAFWQCRGLLFVSLNNALSVVLVMTVEWMWDVKVMKWRLWSLYYGATLAFTLAWLRKVIKNSSEKLVVGRRFESGTFWIRLCSVTLLNLKKKEQFSFKRPNNCEHRSFDHTYPILTKVLPYHIFMLIMNM
jgi:hypothetical protein